MRLFVASENKRLIIKLIFNVQCTLNKSSVCLAAFGFHCIHLQRWIWCCMQLQQDGFKRVARNGCFNVDISTRELATSSEILISNHFHKLRISIQAYAKREKTYGKRVNFSHLTWLRRRNAISQFKQNSCHFSFSFRSLLWISCN